MPRDGAGDLPRSRAGQPNDGDSTDTGCSGERCDRVVAPQCQRALPYGSRYVAADSRATIVLMRHCCKIDNTVFVS